jgi:hypothetical protein
VTDTADTVRCNGVHAQDDWAVDALAAADLPPIPCTRQGRRTGPLEHPVVGRHPLLVIADDDRTRGRVDQICQAVTICLSSAMTTGTDVTVELETRDPRYPNLLLTARWATEAEATVTDIEEQRPFLAAEMPS